MKDMNEKRLWLPSEANFNPAKNPMWEILELLKSIDKNVKEINAKIRLKPGAIFIKQKKINS